MNIHEELQAIAWDRELGRDEKEAAMDRALRAELERELPVMPAETKSL